MLTPETIKTLLLLVAIIAVFVIVPLAIVFTEHQRKMIKLMRGQNEEEHSVLRALLGGASGNEEEIERLRKRVDALERQVAALASQAPLRPPAQESLETRLS